MVREDPQETLLLATQDPQERGVFSDPQGQKDSEEILDVQGLQGQRACRDSQVSKVPKAEGDGPAFQVSQVHPAIPVKVVLQEDQGLQGSPGLQAVQVPPVGKDREGTWGLLDLLE